MDNFSLRYKIEREGGVIAALDYGLRDDDIEDEELSELWYDLQTAYDALSASASEFEDALYNKLDEAE